MIFGGGTCSDIEDSKITSLVAPTYIMLSLMAVASRSTPALKILAEHGKTLKRENFQSHYLWISKRNFRHFYFVGLLSFSTLFALGNCPRSLSFAELTISIHMIRRLLECIHVHLYTNTSRMHIAGWILGIGHYSILPLVFVGRRSKPKNSLISVGVVTANMYFQYEQYQHHHLLAELRNKGRATSHQLPPPKRWFRHILCPHYLAEILLYFTWALMLHDHDHVMESQAITKVGVHYRHWFLFLWVTTNLTVSSLNNYEWYKSRYPNLSQSALIPRVL